MRRSALLVSSLLALFAGCGDQAQRPPAAQPPAQVQAAAGLPASAATAAAQTPFPHEESAFKPDPAVRWGRLPNGARYALMHSAQPQGRVSLRLRIGSGSMLEEDEQQGLAHMLEHMAFNGSKHYAPGELIPSLQRIGIGFGSQLNAHTGFDETVYKIDLPDAKPETIDIGLTVLADQAGGLLLDAAEVERERGVVLAELRDKDGPGLRLSRRELALLTAGTRVGQRMPIGISETISAATPELLRRYYAAWYRPERMILAVVGDADLDLLEGRVRAILGTATALAPAIPEPPLGTLEAGLAAAALHDAEADSTSIRITGLRHDELPADSPEARREQFLRDLGEAVLGRRLGKLIEADAECPLLSGNGFSYQWLGLYLAGAGGDARPGKALDALRLLVTEYRRMAEHGPTADELAVEAAGLKSGWDNAIVQAGSRRNESLAGALYNTVAKRRVFQSPEQNRELGLALLASVTPEAVRDAVRAGWDRRVRTVATVTGRDDLGPDGDKRVATALAEALAIPVAAPAAAAAATWGYASTATYDGPLPAVQADWTIGTANGIAVAAKRTDFQPGQVAIRVRLPVRTGPRAPGLAELTGRGIVDGGLGKHPASQLAEVLAGTTVRVGGFAIEDGAIVINAACAPPDLRRCLELVRAWLDDAAWRPEAESRAKSAWLTALDAERNEVEALTWRRLQAELMPDDAWRRAADRTQAEAATFADAKAWLNPLVSGSPLVCAIVGDVDVNEAMRQTAAVLGGSNRPAVVATATPEVARAALPPQPRLKPGEHRFEVPGSVAKAMVVMAWQTDDIYDVQRSRRLSLLGQVFNERVREVIREKFGDAYSPGAGSQSGEDWAGHGYLLAVVGCQPDRVDAVRDATLEIVRGLAAGVDPAVLDRVRQPALRAAAERRRQNGWWLGLLGRASEQPFRMVWQAGLEADLQAATAEELSALARQYLVPEQALTVIGISRGTPAPLP